MSTPSRRVYSLGKKNKPKENGSTMSDVVDPVDAAAEVKTSVAGSMPGEVKAAPSQGGTVLKNGTKVRYVENPSSGDPGSTSTGILRSGSGGQSQSVSGRFDRNSKGPSRMSAGGTGYERMIERQAFQIDDRGSITEQLEIESPAIWMDNEDFKSPYYVSEDLDFKCDSSGNDGEMFTRPTDHARLVDLTTDKLIFARGQSVSTPLNNVVSYPTRSRSPKGEPVDINCGKVSNYLLRGIKIKATGALLTDVSWDQIELPCEGKQLDLDVRQDHSRVRWNIATDKINTTVRDKLYSVEASDKHLFTPIVDATEQPIEHMMLASDIVTTDGILAVLAVRSYAQAYALFCRDRQIYGSGRGAIEQACAMFDTSHKGFERSREYPQGPKQLALGKLTAMEYIALGDTMARYGEKPGEYVLQGKGLLRPLNVALTTFDKAGFYCDKQSLNVIQQLFFIGDEDAGCRQIGVNRMGVVIPYSPNDVFTYDTSRRELMSKISFRDTYNSTNVIQNVSSPLFRAMVEVIRDYVVPELYDEHGDSTTGEWEITIPFDFSADHFSFAQMLICDAIAKVPQHKVSALAVYTKVLNEFGIDVFGDNLSSACSLSDALKGANFESIEKGFVHRAANDAQRLFIYDPETLDVFFASSGGVTGRATMGYYGHWAYGIDGDSDKLRFNFPLTRASGNSMATLDRIVKMGPKSYLRSRDLPIRLYSASIASVNEVSRELRAKNLQVWAGARLARFYIGKAIQSGSAKITYKDVLCAHRENGRLCPLPPGLLSYTFEKTTGLKSGSLTVKFDSQVTDSVLELGWSATKVSKMLARPVESVTLQGVEQDTTQLPTNSLGIALTRGVWWISTDASQDEINNLASSYGVAINAKAALSVGESTIPAVDTEGGVMDVACDNYFTPLYPYMYIAPFFTNPFGMVDTVDENSIISHAYENESESIHKMCNLAGYCIIDWDQYGTKVTVEKAQNFNLITDNKFETTDNILGGSSTSVSVVSTSEQTTE